MRKSGFPLSLHVLVEKEGSRYFAHVLEFDLITEAGSKEALKKAVEGLVEAHLAYAEGRKEFHNIFRPAPLQYWQKYSQGISDAHIHPRLEEVLI